MSRHFSPKTQKIEPCSGNCLYGNDTPHFSSVEEGEKWMASQAEKQNSLFPEKKTKKAQRLSFSDRKKLKLEHEINELHKRLDTMSDDTEHDGRDWRETNDELKKKVAKLYRMEGT